MGPPLSLLARDRALEDLEAIRADLLKRSLLELHVRANKAIEALLDERNPFKAGTILCRLAEDVWQIPDVETRLSKLGAWLVEFSSVEESPREGDQAAS